MRPSWILSEEERIRRFHGRGRGGAGGKCDMGNSEHEDAASAAVSGSLLTRADLMCPAPICPPSAADGGQSLGVAERLQILQYGEVGVET
jgi:hypothetical protein